MLVCRLADTAVHAFVLAPPRISLVAGVRMYCCSACSYQSKMKSDYDRHAMTHTGRRPFACDMCPRTFRLKRNLNDHKKSHTNEELRKCNICGNKHAVKDCWFNAKNPNAQTDKSGKGNRTAAIGDAESAVTVNPSDAISNVGAISDLTLGQVMQMVGVARGETASTRSASQATTTSAQKNRIS